MPSTREAAEVTVSVFDGRLTAEILKDRWGRERQRTRYALPDGGRVVVVSSEGAWEDGATMVKPDGSRVTGTETITVQRGHMVVATLRANGDFIFCKYRQGSVVKIDPNQWHATYVAGCVVAVISGDWGEASRQPLLELDAKLPENPPD